MQVGLTWLDSGVLDFRPQFATFRSISSTSVGLQFFEGIRSVYFYLYYSRITGLKRYQFVLEEPYFAKSKRRKRPPLDVFELSIQTRVKTTQARTRKFDAETLHENLRSLACPARTLSAFCLNSVIHSMYRDMLPPVYAATRKARKRRVLRSTIPYGIGRRSISWRAPPNDR